LAANIPAKKAVTGKYLPIFDSYLESNIADSSSELATTINNTTFRLSFKN